MANHAVAADDFNANIIEEFRTNGGRVGGPWASTPLILIHHVGAKPGIERVTPLGSFPQPDGQYVIVASNGGSLTHPDWYFNLKANPRITVEVVPRRSRFWPRSWTTPPAPSCGRSWSRKLLSSANTKRGSRDTFRCSC